MTSKLVPPRKVKCEIIMWSKPSHIATSQMQRFADLVEDLVISHNHQYPKKIDVIIDWPETVE